MRDWDDSNGGLNIFKLVTDKSPTQDDIDGTAIPLESLSESAWTRADIQGIEGYCLDLNQYGDEGQKGANLFVVIDSEGAKNKICILASLADDSREALGIGCGRYDKVRVPWGDVYMIWCNLEIANMDFE